MRCFLASVVLLGLGATLVLAVEPPAAAKQTAADGGFVPLLDEQLSRWVAPDGPRSRWKPALGVLNCTGGKGWLYTRDTYSDFILQLEFRISAGSQGAVGLRLPADPPDDALSVMIVDESTAESVAAKPGARGALPTGSVGEFAATRGKTVRAVGEWNSLEITCRGWNATVKLNGEVVNDVPFQRAQAGQPTPRPPQIGGVGLKSTGAALEFRALALKDLATQTASGLKYLDLVEGMGAVVPPTATVAVRMAAWLADGSRVDIEKFGTPSRVSLPETIEGFAEGVAGMKVGGQRKLIIPPALGYGENGVPPEIPPRATLVFDVEVLQIR